MTPIQVFFSSVLPVVLFYGLPLFSVLYFIVSLKIYLSMRKKNKRKPDSVSPKEFRNAKIHMIVSAVIAGALLTVLIAFLVLLAMAVAFM